MYPARSCWRLSSFVWLYPLTPFPKWTMLPIYSGNSSLILGTCLTGVSWWSSPDFSLSPFSAPYPGLLIGCNGGPRPSPYRAVCEGSHLEKTEKKSVVESRPRTQYPWMEVGRFHWKQASCESTGRLWLLVRLKKARVAEATLRKWRWWFVIYPEKRGQDNLEHQSVNT